MNSVGLMLDNFRISFWTDPVSKSGFPEPGPCSIGLGGWPMPHDGTVFWPHLKGSYDPTGCSGDYRVWRLGDVSFLGIAGAYVLHLQSHGLLDAVSIINEQGMGPLVAQVMQSCLQMADLGRRGGAVDHFLCHDIRLSRVCFSQHLHPRLGAEPRARREVFNDLGVGFRCDGGWPDDG